MDRRREPGSVRTSHQDWLRGQLQIDDVRPLAGDRLRDDVRPQVLGPRSWQDDLVIHLAVREAAKEQRVGPEENFDLALLYTGLVQQPFEFSMAFLKRAQCRRDARPGRMSTGSPSRSGT